VSLLDALSKKIVDRSPTGFRQTVDFAALILENENLPMIRSSIEREAYAGVVIGMLALSSHEVTGAWTSRDLAFITEKTRAALAWLSPLLKSKAETCIRSIANVHNLDWRATST
jgi:hypothetical protein